jgi:Tol biopolymer transport system component
MSVAGAATTLSRVSLGLLGLACQSQAELADMHMTAGVDPSLDTKPTEAAERPILFVASRTSLDGQLYAAHADGSDPVRLHTGTGVVDPTWAPDATIVAFRRRSTLDPEHFVSRLELLQPGAPPAVVLAEEGVVTFAFEADREVGGIAWYPDGESLAYAAPLDGDTIRIWSLARSGGQRRRLLPELDVPHYGPSFSSLSGELAYVAEHGQTLDVFVVGLDTGAEPRNLTLGRVRIVGGVRWSPQGNTLIFAGRAPEATPNAGEEIYALDADTLELTALTHDDARDLQPTWSPSGTHVLFASDRRQRAQGLPASAWSSDLWLLPLDQPEQVVALSARAIAENQADWCCGTEELP